MTEDQETEFAWFNDIQAKLKHAFVEGYNHPQAEELAFCVAQGIRDVPNLLRLLDEYENHSNDEILDAVHMVIANHLALNEANRIVSDVRS